MKLHLKSAMCVGLAMLMVMTTAIHCDVYATQDDLDDTNKKIDEIQQQQDDLENSLDDYNDDLSSVSAEVVSIEQQIADKQDEIETTQTDLAAAQEQADDQYEAMKVRIRYIYENGNSSYLEMLLESESFSDFLNRTEYIVNIQNYDRNMLESYQELCTEISDKQTTLQADLDELETLQAQSRSKQSQLSAMILDTQSDLSDSQTELDAQIAKAEEYEAQIEAAKLAEQEAIAAENAANAANNTPIENTYTETAGDLELMAAIIYCEAGGESYEGQLAVGSVVMNRVNSGSFPNSISEVIYQSGQFSPVASGKFALVLSSGIYSSCTAAAQEVLNGNITVNFLYFHSAAGWDSDFGTYIGNQVFY